MITNNMSTVVDGSSDIQASIAGQEIVPTDSNGNQIRYVNYTLVNNADCHLYVNGSSTAIFVPSGYGITLDVIFSIKFVESNITFTWIGNRQ